MSVSGAPSGPLIEGHGLAKAFGERTVLHDVNVRVDPGEIVAIVGLNGAGKSTLVRILLGLLAPDAGRVSRRPGVSVGYMPQRLPIDPALPLTVSRFLSLGKRHDAAQIHAALEEVGAGHLGREAVQTVSGGEMQRVLLARALLREPDLLVLDEPVQGVDVTGQSALYRLIGRIRTSRGCGVLIVSHQLHLVMAATDWVICLNNHVCCAGQPESITRHPEYLALFGEQAATDLAVYAHSHDHVHDAAGNVVPLENERAGTSG
jgi:zinc transport system ATP-binding protein